MTSVSEGAAEFRRPSAAVPPGERGATRIADRVVAKVASQAAREAVGSVTDAARQYANVVVAHETARIRVHVELDYPTDIGARCAAVRRHVAERVGALVGMEVPEVAVHVERLHSAPVQGTAQGRTR
ncbi:Asp23/Gls24 family envelope stress response protein [Streptomyces cyaneochromogenes]|uniref:Asp23/Gls24 family envelope stress response protein n=1 Tax=Streptomyces cyaneochromogenes TaxID=2496836 RepID=A0A3Q9EQJ4_9ACTN|nr:Asp23/Gls24 family envelope stress response protein [Streptomyces cyaneochromogenes]AZQ33851.1 Asp23/Gls24 family envelope stress response protein [Streptomyces cyaneochromogenes]